MSRLDPAAVDWAILAAVLLAAGTGLVGLVTGRSSGGWVFVVHGVVGLALAVLVGLKLRRVAHRVAPSRLNRRRAASVLLAATALGALGTGLLWVLGASLPVAFWTLLNVHILLGLLVVPLAAWHLRYRLRSRASLTGLVDRRAALRYLGLVVVAALAWRVQQVVAAARRFTGSREDGSDAGNDFPVTSWMTDDPDPVAVADWSLTVAGRVERSLDLSFRALDPGPSDGGDDDGPPTDAERALLDCTSGWYSVHDWQGVRVGDLLDAAGVVDEAAWVQFRSVTGYRWSLPIDEARDALLATRVDGERLRHGHGRPLRLVAPGRRGFQWVKWVELVRVTRSRDRSEWVAIFVSGVDERLEG